MSNKYSVTLQPLDEVMNLEQEWLDLEARSNCSFFLSWPWISSWVETFDPECFVLRAEYDGRVVLLALLTKSHFSAPFRFPSTRLHIHQKGNAICDQIWTEYNGFLSEPDHQEAAILAAIDFLQENFSSWDELVVGAITKKSADLLENGLGLERHDLWKTPSYGVNLSALRDKQQDYLSSLSSNTRYQIRRSLKLYQESGGLELCHAPDLDSALNYLRDVAPLHLHRWGDGVSQSGFANERFVAFHENLIKSAWANNQIDFIKILCGSQVVGYFYNFIYRDTVYFYLSGLVREENSKLKPGLCGHALSIQYYLDSGLRYYDFMGGNERYKANLGEQHDELFQVAFRKKRAKFKIESFLRRVKHSFDV